MGIPGNPLFNECIQYTYKIYTGEHLRLRFCFHLDFWEKQSSDRSLISLFSGMLKTNAIRVSKAFYFVFTMIPNTLQRQNSLSNYNAFIRPQLYHWANIICKSFFSGSLWSRIPLLKQKKSHCQLFIYVAYNTHIKRRRAATVIDLLLAKLQCAILTTLLR